MAREIELIGRSDSIAALKQQIEAIGRSDAKVLITGETGVGKALVARRIHEVGVRKDKPFVVVDCAGLPETLLESDLFGHVKGSFTGAYRDKPGKLEQAHFGTAFLDEIGEMTLRMQALLLRFLETGEIQKVGGEGSGRVLNVRVIASTNRDLRKMVKEGSFREDLFYRLNVIHIDVPSLRQRRNDIPILIEHFWRQIRHDQRMDERPLSLSPEAMQALGAYRWPGNVRELQNVIERLAVQFPDGAVTLDNLPPEVRNALRTTTKSDFEITLSSEFSADEVKSVLTALADYYRKCGGLGLAMTFETEKVAVEEPIHA